MESGSERWPFIVNLGKVSESQCDRIWPYSGFSLRKMSSTLKPTPSEVSLIDDDGEITDQV